MYVIKRDGREEPVRFDKITGRLKKLSYWLSKEHCDPELVAQKVCGGVYRGVTTTQLDELAAETAAAMTVNHPDYTLLAGRIAVSNLHKNTKNSFSEMIKDMYNYYNKRSEKKAPLVADDVYEIIMKEECWAWDLFYALWIPDLFMERVRDDGKWSLFCPSEAFGLADCWGNNFENLYSRYEEEGRAKMVISARKLWFEILNSQIETGTPYMLFKDSCNRKSNQQNLGIIKSSNLCTEIIEFSSPEETAVCNLASIALPRYVREKVPTRAC